MRRLRPPLVAALALIAALTAAAPAEARSFVVKARGSQTTLGSVRAVGDFKPGRDPTLAAAIRSARMGA